MSDALLLYRGSLAARVLLDRLSGVESVQKAKPKAKAPLTKPGFVAFVLQLAKVLADIAQTEDERARADAMGVLPKEWNNLTDAQREQVYRRFGMAIGSIAREINPRISDELRKHSTEMVASTKEVMIGRYRLPIAARMSQVDDRVVDHAAKAQASYVTDEYAKRQAAASTQARTIVERGLRDGVDYKEIGKNLNRVLSGQLNRTPAYFETVASIHAARSRTWGQLSSLDEAGLERYQLEATLDEATCFAAGTLVLMGNGAVKRIETIVVDDVVVSSSGVPRRVIGTKVSSARKWFVVSLDNGARLVATAQHPILTRLGWVRAGSIRSGDVVVLYVPTGPGAAASLWGHDERAWMGRRGRLDPRTLPLAPWPRHDLARVPLVTANVVTIEPMPTQSSSNAYDIEVDVDHGFIAEGVVVHNSAVCRLMHGKTFEVSAAIKRHLDVEASGDPESVKSLMPFVGHGKDQDGNEILYVKDGNKRVRVANVIDSGIGKLDDTGKFGSVMSDTELAKRGILVPPFHGRCRTLMIPVF